MQTPPTPTQMLSSNTHVELAAALSQSKKSRVQLEHFSRLHPTMTMADSYAIQREWMRLEQNDGRTVVGHKIGLTSRAMQMASQITEPDYGTLLDDMVLHSGVEIETARFIVPRLEVEFAFVLSKDLMGPNVTLVDVFNATDYVVPALELIDARIEQFDRHSKAPRKVLDTISDNAANGAIVLGTQPLRVDALDWRWAGAMLYKNGVIEETGLGAAVLGHPANGIVWLANRLAAHGEGLKAGQIVLGGSFTRPVACERGDVFHADYGRAGAITARFV